MLNASDSLPAQSPKTPVLRRIKAPIVWMWFSVLRLVLNRILAGLFRRLPIPSTVMGPPKGVIPDLDEYIRKWECRQVWTERGKGYWKKVLREPELVILPGPMPTPSAFVERQFHRFGEVFLLHIPGGRLTLEEGIVLSHDDRVFDILNKYWGKKIECHPIFRRMKLPPLVRKDGVFATLLTPGARSNYYHWLIDALPRLWVLEEAGIRSFNLVVPGPIKPWQRDSLDRLGYDEARRAEFGQEHWQISSLLAPSFMQDSGYIHPQSLQWLRERLLPGGKSGTPRRRVFIPRGKTPRRRLINEDEVTERLVRDGFTVVACESLTFREQVEIFSEAEVVVAPHGAGLANIVFAPPGVRLVELFSPNYVNPCFFSLAAPLEAEYVCLLGTTSERQSKSEEENCAQGFYISVDEVEKALGRSGT